MKFFVVVVSFPPVPTSTEVDWVFLQSLRRKQNLPIKAKSLKKMAENAMETNEAGLKLEVPRMHHLGQENAYSRNTPLLMLTSGLVG